MLTTGNTVLITGGASGIGLGIAVEFLKKGNLVIVCDRSQTKLDQAKAIYPALATERVDITDEEQVVSLLQKCKKEYGGINMLINNAGVLNSFKLEDTDYPMLNQCNEVDVNFLGAVRMIHHFLPLLLEASHGAIVNVSSGVALVPLATTPIYSASKAALHSYTQSLRWRLQDTPVLVFELMPPTVDTEMAKDFSSPKMTIDELVKDFFEGIETNNFEMTPGHTKQLKTMKRLNPDFIFREINKIQTI